MWGCNVSLYGGVAFHYIIIVEAVGWFAYRFQHGRNWWPLVAFPCLFGIVYPLSCSNAVMGVSVACEHKGNMVAVGGSANSNS